LQEDPSESALTIMKYRPQATSSHSVRFSRRDATRAAGASRWDANPAPVADFYVQMATLNSYQGACKPF
jgi:hypothetical protein